MKTSRIIRSVAAKLEKIASLSGSKEHIAWWILENITGQTQSSLILQDQELNQQQTETLERMLNQLKSGKPLQYVLGSVPFCNVNIAVSQPLFIPRPETEQMCLWIVDTIKSVDSGKIKILDLCTGPGTIALALAHALPESEVLGVDINPIAITQAINNAQANDIENVTFIQSDLFTNINLSNTFDLIVSNPPYVAEKEWKAMESHITDWEDKRAFVTEQQGYRVYSQIIKDSDKFLSPSALQNVPRLVLEIGHEQADKLINMLKMAGYVRLEVYKDYAGKDRWISASF